MPHRVNINSASIALDAVALGAFLAIKSAADLPIVIIGIAAIAFIFAFELFYLRGLRGEDGVRASHHQHHA